MTKKKKPELEKRILKLFETATKKEKLELEKKILKLLRAAKGEGLCPIDVAVELKVPILLKALKKAGMSADSKSARQAIEAFLGTRAAYDGVLSVSDISDVLWELTEKGKVYIDTNLKFAVSKRT